MRHLNGEMSALIPFHKRTNFQSIGKYQGSNLAHASRRGAISDKTVSQAMTMLSTISSSSGEPCELSKVHNIWQLAPYHCPLCLANWGDPSLIGESKHLHLPCWSTRSRVISTSTIVQQLIPFHRLPCLSNRKHKANKFTDV